MEILTGTVRLILEKVDLDHLPSTQSQRVEVEHRVFNVEKASSSAEVSVVNVNVPIQPTVKK